MMQGGMRVNMKRLGCIGLRLSAIVFLLLLAWPGTGMAATDDNDNATVYMIMVDKLWINDINADSTPELYKLTEKGAVGLASNRTLRSHNTEDSCLTIGAGNLARAYDNGLMGFNRGETVPKHKQTAAELYWHLTGIDPGLNACLLTDLPEILVNTSQENVNTIPGVLGENLRRSGKTVCVLGNGDSAAEMLRSAVAVGMDANGLVALGDVGPNTYITSVDSFASLETNYPYLQKKVKEYRGQADVIIIDLSDLARLEKADLPLPEIGAAQKQRTLKNIDDFIGNIINQVNPERDLLLVLSSSPSREQLLLKDSFTAVIAYGQGYRNAMLSSGATRRSYVVANTDIAATVLNFFGIKDYSRTIIGQPLQAKADPGANRLAKARDVSNEASMLNRLRVPLIKGYVVIQIMIILLGLLAIFYNRHLKHIMEPLIILMVVVPLVFLFIGILRLGNDWLYILAAIAASLVLTYAAMRVCRQRGYKAFLLIGSLTLLVLNLDLLTGSNLIRNSILGYDPMAGARYYGVGNEFMGIMVGSLIAVAAALYEKIPRWWMLGIIGAVFLGQCYVIAGPSLGANSDGILTAPAAFLVTLVLLANIKIRPWHIISIMAVILAAILGLSIYDMHRPVELQSHIGRAASLIAAGGWQEGFTIISRKLAMNLKLIRYTIWSWVFIVTLIVLSLLVYRPVGAMDQLMKEHPYLVKGFAGIIAGAMVGLIVNDSGIVAAATTSIYLVVPILLLMLHLKEVHGFTMSLGSQENRRMLDADTLQP